MTVPAAPAVIPIAGATLVTPSRAGDGLRLRGSSSGTADFTISSTGSLVTVTCTGFGIGGSPVSQFTIPVAPSANANFGVVSLGSGGFAGSASHFAGSSSGTHLAISAATGYVGNLIDAQVAGVRGFVVTGSCNVGIGPTLPTVQLEISAFDTATVRLTSTDTTLSPEQIIGKVSFWANDASSNGTGEKAYISAVCIGASGNAGALVFAISNSNATTSTEAMRIDNAGRVLIALGLGSSITPASLLDVAAIAGGIFTLRRVDTSINANDMVGKIQFHAADTSTITNFIVADIEAQATNTVSTDINPGRLIFRTTPTTVAATPVESFRITEAQDLQIADGKNFILNNTTGTKFGTATGQKMAWWNATPVVQQVLATGAGATVDNVISLLQTLGLCRQS